MTVKSLPFSGTNLISTLSHHTGHLLLPKERGTTCAVLFPLRGKHFSSRSPLKIHDISFPDLGQKVYFPEVNSQFQGELLPFFCSETPPLKKNTGTLYLELLKMPGHFFLENPKWWSNGGLPWYESGKKKITNQTNPSREFVFTPRPHLSLHWHERVEIHTNTWSSIPSWRMSSQHGSRM